MHSAVQTGYTTPTLRFSEYTKPPRGCNVTYICCTYRYFDCILYSLIKIGICCMDDGQHYNGSLLPVLFLCMTLHAHYSDIYRYIVQVNGYAKFGCVP